MNEIYLNLHNRSPKHQAMNTLDVQVKKVTVKKNIKVYVHKVVSQFLRVNLPETLISYSYVFATR